jgi:hypothetical protein
MPTGFAGRKDVDARAFAARKRPPFYPAAEPEAKMSPLAHSVGELQRLEVLCNSRVPEVPL